MKKLVSFFEIPTADFGRAVKFYETVLNLELSVMECESEKMAFFPDEDGLAPGHGRPTSFRQRTACLSI